MGTDKTAMGHQGTKSRGNTAKAKRFDGSQFVQYELDKAQQAEVKGWEQSADQILYAAQEMVDSGYKFTLKWDTYGECYACFCMQGTDGGDNAGFVLTGRGSSVLKSLKQVLYKHLVCLEGDWSGHVERRGVDAIDD